MTLRVAFMAIFFLFTCLALECQAEAVTDNATKNKTELAEINSKLAYMTVEIDKVNRLFVYDSKDSLVVYSQLKPLVVMAEDVFEATRRLAAEAEPADKENLEKLSVDIARILDRSKSLIRAVQILKELEPIQTCMEKTNTDSLSDEQSKELLVNGLDIQKFRSDTESLLGKQHPIFLKIDTEVPNKSEQTSLLMDQIVEKMVKAKDLDFTIKATVILSVHVASAINPKCIPSQKILNFMEQVPHAD